jgi:intergrase/recombinase
MRKITVMLSFLLAVSTTGCISAIVKNAAKDTPIANKIDIHSGARTGDYAVLKSVKSDELKKEASASMNGGRNNYNYQGFKERWWIYHYPPGSVHQYDSRRFYE